MTIGVVVQGATGYAASIHYHYAIAAPGESPPDTPPGGRRPDTPGGRRPDTPGGRRPDTPGGRRPDTPGGGMTLITEKRLVKQGELVRIPVFLRNAANVASMNFTLKYRSEVAKPEGQIAQGSLLSDALFEANPGTAGIIRFGFAQDRGASGTGSVAMVPFRAAGAVGSRTPLTLAVTGVEDPGGRKLTVALVHGEIVVVDKEGFLPGDANGDGKVDSRDAREALRMSVQLIPTKMRLDMNGDNEVTARDAVLILQMWSDGRATR